MNIYIYAFARRFIQNVLYCKEYFFSVYALPGNQNHDLGIANAMLCWIFILWKSTIQTFGSVRFFMFLQKKYLTKAAFIWSKPL